MQSSCVRQHLLEPVITTLLLYLLFPAVFDQPKVHADVTQRYDIPMASFRHAVWPVVNDTAVAETIWGTNVHPDWKVHQLMADVVAFYFQKSYARFCEVYGLVDKPSVQEVSQ